MSFSALLQRVQRGLSTLELVHTSHLRWPLPTTPGPHLAPTLHISVLDSSFNPPTNAHAALARAPLDALGEQPDATLLLLSVTNADKAPKPGQTVILTEP